MMSRRIGTIIHGAFGDCYEQLCAIKLLKSNKRDVHWIGFFATRDRMDAMIHFSLDFLDEVHPADDIQKVPVDEYYQFQVKDEELRRDILYQLPRELLRRFNIKDNILPWSHLKSIDYTKTGISLDLSEAGRRYLPTCYSLNGISEELFSNKFTVGYLWRHRAKGGAVNPLFQKPKEWILQTKSDLFNELIHTYNAHIIIAGMGKEQRLSHEVSNALHTAGVLQGEINCKFTDARLDIPDTSATYLKGLGYAAEMEIMSRCDLLLMMPSGFSEPLWMKRNNPVLLLDPPPVYMAKLWRHRMPFFNNHQIDYAVFNMLVQHNKSNVITFLERHDLLRKRSTDGKMRI